MTLTYSGRRIKVNMNSNALFRLSSFPNYLETCGGGGGVEGKFIWPSKYFPPSTLQGQHKNDNMNDKLFSLPPRLPHTSNMLLSSTLSSIASWEAFRALTSKLVSALNLAELHF